MDAHPLLRREESEVRVLPSVLAASPAVPRSTAPARRSS